MKYFNYFDFQKQLPTRHLGLLVSPPIITNRLFVDVHVSLEQDRKNVSCQTHVSPNTYETALNIKALTLMSLSPMFPVHPRR